LSYLGDIGGFKGALNMLVEGIGAFFSAKFFLASISNRVFI